MEKLLVNTGYVLMLVALLIGDILWLRTTLMVAQAFIIVYNIVIHNPTVTFWNCIFVGINSVQVVRIIIKRRPAKIATELVDLYQNVFSLMTPKEFVNFWRLGQNAAISNGPLIKEGSLPTTLILITTGQANVVKGAKTLAQLSRGQFAAEMSYISHSPASAQVIALGDVTYHEWNRDTLEKLSKSDRDVYIKIQSILGFDLVEKVRKANVKSE